MYIDRNLVYGMTYTDITKWFNTGVFKRVFSASRLFKFNNRATSALKLVSFATWSSYANDVSKETLVEIMKYRDVDVYIKKCPHTTCNHCSNNSYIKCESKTHTLYYFCNSCKCKHIPISWYFLNVYNMPSQCFMLFLNGLNTIFASSVL